MAGPDQEPRREADNGCSILDVVRMFEYFAEFDCCPGQLRCINFADNYTWNAGQKWRIYDSAGRRIR